MKPPLALIPLTATKTTTVVVTEEISSALATILKPTISTEITKTTSRITTKNNSGITDANQNRAVNFIKCQNKLTSFMPKLILNNLKISKFVIIYAIIFIICVNFELIHAYTVKNNENSYKNDIKLNSNNFMKISSPSSSASDTLEEKATSKIIFNELPLLEIGSANTIVSKSSITDTLPSSSSASVSPSLSSFASSHSSRRLVTSASASASPSSLLQKSSSLQDLQANKNVNDDNDYDDSRSNSRSSSQSNIKDGNNLNKNDDTVVYDNDIKIKINAKTDGINDNKNDINNRDYYHNYTVNLNNGNDNDDIHDDFDDNEDNDHHYYYRHHQRFRHLWNNRKKRQLLRQTDQTSTSTSPSSSSALPSSSSTSPAATVSTIYNGWKKGMDIEEFNDRQGSCSSSFFTCGDGKCIPLRWKCDSKPDCNDGSDESAECAHETKCNEGQFQCTFSRKCIPEKWLCDGDYDCGKIYDLSDEQNCLNTNKCLSYQTTCDNGYCLDISKFCDGKWDCDSDEKNCENKNTLCSSMNCEYQCTLTSQGPTCYCPSGKEPNGTKCQDFDECTINGVCDQICKNTPGSYECSCVSGYTIKKNRCYAINVPKNENASLVFLTQGDIRTTTLDGKQLSLYKNQDTSAIEIWHRNRTVCAMYTSPLSPILRCHKIEDLNINWEMPIPNILTGLNSIDQIRIDWISNNWYFLNNELSLIFMCTSDMKHCIIILENVLNKPSSMALDPTKGFLFITEWNPSLTRCNLDGSNRMIIATNKIFYPSEITLDLANEHVYWIDTFTDFVERVDYNGNNRWSMKKSSESYLFIKALHSLDIFENTIYLSSWSNKSISAMDKFTLKAERIISKVVRAFDLRVFHRQKQPEVAHPCRHQNGGCNHICVPLWKDKFAIPQCVCSAGYKLKSKTECVLDKIDKFLLYVKQRFTRIKGIPLLSDSKDNLNLNINVNDSREVIVPIYNVKWPLTFDINVKEQRIYFMQVDVRRFSISNQKLDGTDRKLILNGTESVTGLAYDWISDHIFWGDLHRLYVASLNDITLKRSFNVHTNPESIAIDPVQGIIYWSHWSAVNYNGMIKSAWFDGSHKTILAESSKHYPMKWPDSLTIDFVDKKIYWCDIEEKSIERMDLDGKSREILLKHKLYSPISIAYHNQLIYWVNNENGTIMYFNVNDERTNSKTKQFNTFAFEKDRIANLKIFDNHSQIETTNGCINSKCPGLCLQTPIGPICKCSDGYSLNGNGSKCIPNINFDIPTNCTKGKGFTCTRSRECIESKDICDGFDDCDDGSDEDYSDVGICNVKNCDKTINFVCDKTRCFQKSLRCSSMSYCADGTDHINCTTATCKSEEFTCKQSGKCIPKSWVNDGSKDCGPYDMSDEMPILFAKCPEFECKNKLCVQFVEICDGLNQCGDNSDEIDCDSQCGTDEKYCVPFGCYGKTNICDGIIDCLDASDEMNCTTTISPSTDNYHEKITPICGYKEFTCKESFECIPEHFRCNGIDDCYDKSDEMNCTTIIKIDEQLIKMNETMMICNHPDRLCSISNKCITVDKLCDGTMDCEDGTDEGFRCFEKICDHNTDCSHYCHNAPEGFVCSCPLHMYLQPNGLRCSMEHSCEYWDTCSQICEKHGKTYSCKCHEGYTLQYDKFSCKSNNKDSPYVIFSNRQEIRGVDLKTSAVKNFYASLRNTIALDFLFLNNSIQIFWTDVIDDKIYRGTLIGESIGNVEAVVQSGLSTAEGLAVDWIAMNLYWIDSNLDQIEVALVNGSFRRTLVAGEMESPRAIALDPREGWLFWTDWDENFPRIERCSMAGEYRKIITQVNQISGAWPNGLTLDYTQRRVYWVDARSDSIHTTNYDGGDHHLVIRDQETLSHPFSISLFENYVYWTDWRTNSVIRANKWNGSDIQVIHRTQTQPFGIQVLHSSRQPKDINPCGTNNGGCSHLCLINVNKTYKCECPHVMRLDQKDQKTCVPNEQVLLFIMGNEIRGIDLMQPNHHTIPTISHSPQVLGPQRIDYTVDDNRLYWSDTQLNEIKTAGLSNGLIETILNTDIQKPFGFAVDWISKHLYVSSVKMKCQILVCNIKGEYVTEIHRDLNIVESIALDPANGKMYWSHSNKESEVYQIEISALDGSSRRQLYNCSKPAQSLTIDFDSNRLYFVYYNSGIISYYDLTLQKVYDVLSSSEVMSISSVTVYNNSLYFPENIQSVIMSCDKNNCHQTMNILRKNTNSVQALKMYYLGAQKGTNTCAKNKGGCQHLCLAVSNVGHVCKCAIGFDQDLNHPTQCVGKSELLLYSIGHELKGSKIYSKEEAMNLNLDEEEKDKVLGPIPLISLATNIDYHIDEDYIYWADSEKGTITRVKRDGTKREVILKQFDQLDPNNSDWLGGIAVDWVANNIYWSDQKRNMIEVARLNGSARYIVISSVEKPTALAVDPVAGLLFYVGDGFIGRTGLDGSQMFILVNQTKSVSNLVLDIDNQMVYWCETNNDYIMRVDYDGNRKTVMLNHSLDNPVALALIDNFMYWADNSHHKGTIKVASVHNLSDYSTIVKSEGNSIKDLKIFSKRIQRATNICADNNGGCEELCLYNGTHPVCACSHGRIAADGKSCEDHDIFLIYSTGTAIESIHMTDHTNMNSPIETIKNFTYMRNIIGLSYDYENRRIFYSDIHLSTINMVYFNGTNHTTIVNNQVTVEGLTFDPLNSQLYWTSNNDASIRSLDLKLIGSNVDNNTNLIKQILKLNSHDKPRGIQAEPCLAMVYWTNWNSQAASIQRAYVSGYGLESVIKTDIRMPNALALDYEQRKLYWADARLDKVERADYDGSHRVVLAHSTPKHPFAMAVYGDILFWTDWVLHAVVRANKYSGSDVIFLRKDIGRPMGIAAVQNLVHNCDSNKCNIVNGGCEDVCLLDKDENVICQCTRGKLAPDGHSCIQPISGKCGPGEFLCSSGECIPYTLTCDTVPHCLDQSDEKTSFCFARECPEDFFKCSNHRCILMNQTCDGVENCGDLSDEIFCPCDKDKFKCDSGECIDELLRCDNVANCRDASDEINCPMRECASGDALFFHCERTTACYMQSWRCDGENDCWDGSDETNCENVTKPACGPGQFRCDNGHCINERWRCDGEDDCVDGKQPSSDEMNCQVQCKPNEFKCDNTCIPSTWQCDETPDCRDGSDEGPQCAQRECSEFMFKCNSSGRCIPQKWVCDGEADCVGREDEPEDCAIVSVTRLDSCYPPYFLCASGECLEPQHVCDGDRDCEHGDDEYSGCIPSQWAHPECSSNEFRCDNNECIPKNATCDLKNDCSDNSDENPKMCQNSTKICAGLNFFRCANGACVHSSKLCDGRNDCGDFSDEQSCEVNECLIKDLCSQNCTDLKVGYECSCFKGFKVNHEDRHLCEDVDECVEERPCSQICYNTVGSYHCGCIEGFQLKDKTVCKATSNEHTELIFSNRYYIRKVGIHGNMSILVHQLSNAVALDFEWESECLFWSDVTSTMSAIKKHCFKENKTTTLHHTRLENPDGLAVDWVGRNLYWCDKGLDTIEVSNLDGLYRRVLIKKNLREPRGIALDPFNRYIYWSDWGEIPYIAKAGMDGSKQKIIIQDNLGWPNALTISFETNELFWGDAREDFIAVSDLDGKNQRILLSRSINLALKLHHVFAIAVWEDKIFWSDWETKSIEYCHKYSGQNCSTLTTLIHRPMDLRVYHPYRQLQPKTPNPCDTAGCSTLCLLSPDPPYYKCMCPNDYILQNDTKSCKSNCTSAHFECVNTYKCIPFYWKCDTQDDCGDNSDEPEDCRRYYCEPGQFQCENTKCISPSLICDSKDDCGDKSDERNCNEFTCFDNYFKCGASFGQSAFCIDAVKKCDGKIDCVYGEDERDCKPVDCPRNQFRCPNGRCIPLVWVCDGDNDCRDDARSDELRCEDRNCTSKEFLCNSGRCIPRTWRCDGQKDCSDAEDEPPDCYSSQDHPCEPTYFKCKNSKCIPGRWHCDYENDCGDRSDEMNCQYRNCSESEFRCWTGKCIRHDHRCDGEINCIDGADEIDCHFVCKANEFKCNTSNTCINMKYKCDGDDDCPDGSDEVDCTCPSDHFVCSNGKCIMNRWRCDGWSDCADGSDESIEVCAHIPCHANAFKCPNMRCIRKSALCDGVNDCGDNSDEAQKICDSLPKCRHDQFQCENDVCISKKLRCDGQYNCVDGSDEMNCQSPVCGFGRCSQICIEKKAENYNCKCVDGYQKGKEKNDTCFATGPEQILLLSSEQEFRFILPQKDDGTTVMGYVQTGSLKIDVFDVLIRQKDTLLFWIDSHHNKIHTMKLDTLSEIKNDSSRRKRSIYDVRVFDIPNLDDPKSLAVDWVTSKLYVIDSKHNKIIATDIEGKQYVSLVSTGMHPTDIVLEPELRIMIWSTLENGILVSSLDGTNKKSLVEIDVGWPISLSIDYPTGRLYWVDYRKGTIETCLLNGKDRHVVKRFENSEKPQKIDVFEDFLYIKLYDQSIIRMNKFGNDNGTYVLKGYRSSDIAIIHPLKQNRNISNPCNKYPCEDKNSLCILSSETSNGRTCTCPSDMIMAKVDGKSECRSFESIPEYCPLKCSTGHCKIVDHIPKCICPPEFDGEMCEHYRCSGYCLNEGYCQVLLEEVKPDSQDPPPLKCKCKEEWGGTRCNISVTECQSRCHNGGTCSIVEDVQSCECPSGFLGDKCEHCVNLTCENGAVCRETVTGSTQCDCPDGYFGKRCEINVCNGYCNGHGKCTIGIRGPQCECDPGYWGKQCETNSCKDYCHNNGVCMINGDEPICTCLQRYSGKQCQIDLCQTAHPPEFCDSSIVPIRTPCTGIECQNGGVCHIIRNVGICNCTEQWNGELCDKKVGYDNACSGFCSNGAICQLDNFMKPKCICIGEWDGLKCNNPPLCMNGCGVCRTGSSINECLCDDGSISPCNSESTNMLSEERQNTAEILTILAVILSILVLIISLFGATVMFLKKRRLGQPFSHARLTDNVEITNPMYLGDIDDGPSFVHEDDKGNFANPVYESMYAGSIQDHQSTLENNSTAPDERKGLLQHSHDEHNAQQDIL